jgi:hypothetical protein
MPSIIPLKSSARYRRDRHLLVNSYGKVADRSKRQEMVLVESKVRYGVQVIADFRGIPKSQNYV